MFARTTIAMLAASAAFALPAPAAAQDLTLEAVYTADVVGPLNGANAGSGRYLDNLDVTVDLEFETGRLHAYVLANGGGVPNDLVGTLQGVDNIEVGRQAVRLFELWAEKDIGSGSVLGGLYNLNSEFYVNDSAGLLIAPPFGIGSELAATGPNGPSIFPSTALGVRVNANIGEGAYVRAAALNAKSGVVGDPDGVDIEFADGALLIAEAGFTAPIRIGLGAWSYTEKQEDIRTAAPARAQGVYLLGETRLFGNDQGRAAAAFFRVGVSDGDTTPFTGGWQAGVRVSRVFEGRPDSELSIGAHQGRLSNKFQANLADAGTTTADAETGVEITYSDRVHPRVTLQPDLQWINGAAGEAGAQDRWIAGLRVKIALTASE